MHRGVSWGDFREGDHLKDLGVDRRIALNGSLRTGMGTWTGFISLRIGTVGGLL